MQHFTVKPEDSNLRIDKWCKTHLPHLAFGLIQKACRTGMIKINGRKCGAEARLQAGDDVQVADSLTSCDSSPAASQKEREHPHYSAAKAEEMRYWTIFEDTYCMVINKPAGLAAQGGSGITDSVDMRMRALYPNPVEMPRLAHRIDRDTSGILLLGKNRLATAGLTEAFRHKSAQKIYWAIVMGIPEQPLGTIDFKLTKKQAGSNIEKMSVVLDEEEGEAAITHYRVIESNERHSISWVECMPVTGRTHQLRVHLQAIGHPIYGDGKYGGKEAFHPRLDLAKQLHLHARELRLSSPRPYHFKAPAPEHFAHTLEQLKFPRDDMGVSLLELF